MIIHQAAILALSLAATFDVAAARTRVLKSSKSSTKTSKKSKSCITQAEAQNTITEFGNAAAAIQAAHTPDFGNPGVTNCTAAYEAAIGALNVAYAYNLGEVLFKPTVSSFPFTYRNTLNGALSYFIGTDCMIETGNEFPPGNDEPNIEDRSFSEDGFATSRGIVNQVGVESREITYTDFTYLTSEVNPAFCDAVVANGRICFPYSFPGFDPIGCVDKTFTLVRGEEGQLPAVLIGHHSSGVVTTATQTVCQDPIAVPVESLDPDLDACDQIP